MPHICDENKCEGSPSKSLATYIKSSFLDNEDDEKSRLSVMQNSTSISGWLCLQDVYLLIIFQIISSLIDTVDIQLN